MPPKFNEKDSFDVEMPEDIDKFQSEIAKDIGKEIDRLDELDLKNKQPIMALLDEKEPEYKYLDIGNTEDFFYYGFNLKGRETIITSQHKILRNTLEKVKTEKQEHYIGVNEIKKHFNYSGYIGNIAPIIKNETIKQFFSTKKRLINPQETYSKIRDLILYYMDFSGQDEIASVLACWIMATYTYPLFYWFPHILINAPSGSGKSKCGQIVMNLSFRGFDLGASAGVSPAQIYRTLEANRGTILLDEFEVSTNKQDDTQRLVCQILNASTTKDSYVIRTEQINKKWKSEKFPIFCPKIVCNITGINATSLSRFISFKWLKTESEKSRRKIKRKEDFRVFEEIRSHLYIFGLENWKQIKEVYEELSIPHLKNREEDNWLPLFSIAKLLNPEVEQDLNKYLENYQEVEVETEDLTNEFFNLLYEFVSEKEQQYTPKEISLFEPIKEILSTYKSPANFIGKKLKLYKFKSTRGAAGKKYFISKSNVNNILKIYFSTDKTTLNDTNYTNNTNNTNNTKSVVSVYGVVMPERSSEIYSEESLSNFIPLSYDLVDFGRCSYCGKEKQLTAKDSKGNFVCSYCAGID